MYKLVIIFFLLCTQISLASAASEERSPRFLVHLLDYLAKDYGGAVSNGKVISKSEYAEQVEFSESALKTNEALSETKSTPEIGKKIKELNHLIQSKADADQVSKLAREIQAEVIALTHLEISPSQWPSLKRGQKLFAQNCVMCHGATGDGSGPAGVALDPKPANFLDDHMRAISPFQAFNTIRLGVPGTGMAPYHSLSDQEVWDLPFYVKSLRSQGSSIESIKDTRNPELLKMVATSNDDQLETKLKDDKSKTELTLAALRISSDDDSSGGNSLSTAKKLLGEAGQNYEKNDFDSAKTAALRAYLEGIEPVEPRLKATDPNAVSNLETKMAAVRGAIEGRVSLPELKGKIELAQEEIDHAEALLKNDSMSPGLAFTAAAAILLREGFEAVLIIIALLGVIRASGSRRAALWVHGGWISALGVGALCWLFAGFLMDISGAQRETLEGATSLFAVIVLLVVGFWLHSQTEIGRWKAFIHGRVQKALDGKNLWALASMSFIAVFREAIETILFLKAITVEGAEGAKFAVGAGVITSLVVVIGMAWAILRYSAKLPIRKLFEASAMVMAVLSVILVGKGLHSFQEIGAISVTNSPVAFHFDLVGIYPTWETMISQLAVLGLVFVLWNYGKRPKPTAAVALQKNS